jgi:hypothetical protein
LERRVRARGLQDCWEFGMVVGPVPSPGAFFNSLLADFCALIAQPPAQ